jgi:hypothetical protein
MRRSFTVVGLVAVAGLAITPIAAAIEKRRHPSVGDADSDLVALSTIFDGTELHSTAMAFRGGSSICWYGGQVIDLRGAALAPEGARLDARCIFGGLRIVVPETWRVSVRSRAIFGGTDDRSSGPKGEGPLLTIEAVSVFGGVSVMTKPDDAWDRPRRAGAQEPSGAPGDDAG